MLYHKEMFQEMFNTVIDITPSNISFISICVYCLSFCSSNVFRSACAVFIVFLVVLPKVISSFNVPVFIAVPVLIIQLNN